MAFSKLVADNPDVIITPFARVLFDTTRTLSSALEFLQKLKEKLPDCHICAIGEQASFRPERTLSYPFVNSVVRFSAELTVKDLCLALQQGKKVDEVVGVLTKTNFQKRLNDKLWLRKLDSLANFSLV
jgi:uroporphyrinogen-III synthase